MKDAVLRSLLVVDDYLNGQLCLSEAFKGDGWVVGWVSEQVDGWVTSGRSLGPALKILGQVARTIVVDPLFVIPYYY